MAFSAFIEFSLISWIDWNWKSTSVTPDNVAKVDRLILEDCRMIIRQLPDEVEISVRSIEEIVHNQLKFHEMSAWRILRFLSLEDIDRR